MMTQARKTLELRIEFLVDAISKCHMAVATRKRWKEIEASMDDVEIAWDRIKRTSSEFVSRAGLNLDHLPMMVEMVLMKAEKYLAKAQAKAEKYAEAQMGPERWAKAVKYREAQVQALEVNEVALEVSAVDEVNKVAPEVSAVGEVNVNDVKKENEVNVKEAKSDIDVEAKEEVLDADKSSRVVKGKPLEVPQRYDFAAKVQEVEESGMKGEKNLKGDKRVEVKKSCRPNWDPGEFVDAKAQVERLDAKVGLRGDANWKAFCDAMELHLIVLFNVKEMLIVLFPLRFVNGFRRECPIEPSDYG